MPVDGDCYIVGSGATGAWTGEDAKIAASTSGGWRFLSPVEGMAACELSSGCWMLYRGGSWESGVVRATEVRIGGEKVLGARVGAVAGPSGGAVVDAEARAAVGAILGALRQHGLIDS